MSEHFTFEDFGFDVDQTTSEIIWDGEGKDDPSAEVYDRAQSHWWFVLQPQPAYYDKE
jgi:hypothetical protein